MIDDRENIHRRHGVIAIDIVVEGRPALFAFGIAQGLVALTAVIQFLSLLITRQPNTFLTNFGRSLGQWLAQTAQFQSCASDERPFPWAPWPTAS